MNYALKFPGRTRQKKYLFSFLIIFILCPLVLSISPLGVQASESAINSVASPDVVGSAASNEENIDSFDVHPVNRWTISETGFTTVCEDGLLNISDVGDGSSDYYQMTRDLRDIFGTIEFRFKIDSNETVHDTGQQIKFTLRDSTNYIQLYSYYLDSAQVTRLTYNGIDGTVEQLDVDDDFILNVWYTVRIDYDILKSEVRLKCFFDNGTRLWNYDWYDFGDEENQPLVFSATDLYFYFRTYCKSVGQNQQVYLDYVDAPFKEREWRHTTSGGSANWLVDETWMAAEFQDDISSEEQVWRLSVPRLDDAIGVMVLSTDDHGSFSVDDLVEYIFRVYCVDGDDGGLHEAFEFKLMMNNFGGSFQNYLVVQVDGVEKDAVLLIDSTIDAIWLSYGVSTHDDRSVMAGYVLFGTNIDDRDVYTKYEYDIPVVSVATDPTQEFLLEVEYFATLNGNTEVSMWFESFKLLFREQWKDFATLMDDRATGDPGIVQQFMDWLAGLISWAVNGIIEGLGIGAIIAGLQAGISGIVADIQGWINGVFDFAAGVVGDVIDAAITWLLTVISDLWDILVGIIFFAWDAVGLPDILDLGNELLAYFIELINWTLATFLDVVQLAADLSWLILVLWWLWAIPFQWARANFDPLGGIAYFIEVYFYDALPWGIFGCHLYIPQGIVFTLWLILLLPADFAIFGAMGL